MANNIRYVCCCNTGRIRKNNQDNFFVDWKYLYSENFALETPLTGMHSVAERPAYAVFDGMGGENFKKYLSSGTIEEIDSNAINYKDSQYLS